MRWKQCRVWIGILIVFVTVSTACNNKHDEAANPAEAERQTTEPPALPNALAPATAAATANTEETNVASPEKAAVHEGPRVHDPAHPPVDCPMRKAGVDLAQMKPFEEVEEYIAFLEREDRAIWQKPDDIIAALGLNGDEVIDDLGAGSGYFTFRFSAALPRGRVIAADVEPEMLRHIHHKAMLDGIENIEAKLIDANDPAVPDDVDLVFICDVLHHVADRPTWLAKVVAHMPSGARLVLVEFKEGDIPEGPPETMKLPRADLVKLVTDASLELVEERPELLPYQTFLVFKKP